MINFELFDEKSEILDLVLPPKTNTYTREIYAIFMQHIVLVQGEFGVGFRETRAGLVNIFKEYNLDYSVVKPIVDDIEYRYLIQFNEESDKKKSKH